MRQEIFRHYGHAHFDIDKFNKVSNLSFRNKPYGGLWACPTIDVDIDWQTWSEQNDFYLDRLKDYFDFKLKKNANIYEVKTIEDIKLLPRVSHGDGDIKSLYDLDTMNVDIDFEELSKEYDGIMIWMYRGNLDMEHWYDSVYYKIYGWDVDTLVVFNPNIVEEVGSSDN